MKISEMRIGKKYFTQLGTCVLAVLSRREDGWSVYVGAVPGQNHDEEWQEVARNGDKQIEPVARAIAYSLFHPGFEIDLPYVK